MWFNSSSILSLITSYTFYFCIQYIYIPRNLQSFFGLWSKVTLLSTFDSKSLQTFCLKLLSCILISSGIWQINQSCHYYQVFSCIALFFCHFHCLNPSMSVGRGSDFCLGFSIGLGMGVGKNLAASLGAGLALGLALGLSHNHLHCLLLQLSLILQSWNSINSKLYTSAENNLIPGGGFYLIWKMSCPLKIMKTWLVMLSLFWFKIHELCVSI